MVIEDYTRRFVQKERIERLLDIYNEQSESLDETQRYWNPWNLIDKKIVEVVQSDPDFGDKKYVILFRGFEKVPKKYFEEFTFNYVQLVDGYVEKALRGNAGWTPVFERIRSERGAEKYLIPTIFLHPLHF